MNSWRVIIRIIFYPMSLTELFDGEVGQKQTLQVFTGLK